MPAVRKVSKEQIIDAAVEVLRDDGFSAINARSVAKKLGCSTQPIYFSFKNMDELKAALTQRAIELHTQRVRDSLRAHEGSDSRYSSYGMGFVKFAAEEKQLFRWLYLEGEQPGAYQSDVLMQEVIGVIVDEFGYAEDVARRFHQDMIYFIEADGYLYIDCLWVSGSMKGHGYSNDLLEACIRDAKAQGKKGICILCAEGRKREFLADPKFLAYKGFRVADISDCGINLMYLSIEPTAQMPKFRECAKHPAIEDNGFVLYYTDQCPYTYYWVPRVQEVAKEHGIPFKAIHITDKESAQNVPAPVTTYALFRDGQFLTQSIQSDKKFLALAGL